MSDLQTAIENLLRQATASALGDEFADADPLIRPADPRFGDYQANLAMGLAKRARRKPRELAEAIAAVVPTGGPIEAVEVAGPGFINVTLSARDLAQRLAAMLADAGLGVPRAHPPATVVVDYASPNLAKEMHIGHLRSTILGDAIVRVLEQLGHRVIRQNHLGDWGTQFGMLLEHLIDTGWDRTGDHTIGDLNALYRNAKERFDREPEFAERARRRVVALQGGDEKSLDYWRQLIAESKRHMTEVFDRLGVRLVEADVCGESFYNDRLDGVVEALQGTGLLVESDGAQVVFPDGYTNRDGDPLPMIVRKSDGGYGYAATDLAAGRYRISELGAQRLVYVVDSRQTGHFGMLFWALRAAGWAGEDVALDYVPFGTILGVDKKPFKTREGGTIRLVDVLDEAAARARAILDEKQADRPTDLDEASRQTLARTLGVGAVKYADLSNDRIKDYVFDWDRMLAFDGNTAPYLINAYVRVRSIFRRGGEDPAAVRGDAIRLTDPAERALALQLLKLPRAVAAVADKLEPHHLCTYLYELAAAQHQTYERCPVLNAPDEATRRSRLALCELTARTLRFGLGLLGIGVVERM